MLKRFSWWGGLWAPLALFLALPLISCASSQTSAEQGTSVPAWYLNPEAEYPNSAYLTGTGRGRSLAEAKRFAAGELSQLFSAKINFDSQAEFRYSESGAGDGTDRNISQSVNVSSDEEITGLEYSEPYTDGNGRVNVLAYLDRAKVGKIYSHRIEERSQHIADLAKRGESSSDDLTGFILFDYASELARRNQMQLQQLQIISPKMHNAVASSVRYNAVSLADQREAYAGRLGLAVDFSGDSQLSALGGALSQEFSKLGFPILTENSKLELKLELSTNEIKVDNPYVNLAWDVQVSLSYQGKIISRFSKSGRESGPSRSRALTTLKRNLDKNLRREFMTQVYEYFASVAGVGRR